MAEHAPASLLLEWYDEHARSLPWRIGPSIPPQQADPYRVWLSEIMLQQTGVTTVIPYFVRFIERWPTVQALASASPDELRGAWAGLGYYRRAANLHACAQRVIAQGGHFPRTAEALKELPGIGDYTGAAIAAIAFGEPVAVVDGNVERVMTRLLALETPLPKVKRQVHARLVTMVPTDRPGDFAQAMMDLGATICTPKSPSCPRCPWTGLCVARTAGTMESYPRKLPRQPRPYRHGAALVICRPSDGAIWCEARPAGGLLPSMTQVPTSDWTQGQADGFDDARHVGRIDHVFTHFSLMLDVYRRDSEAAPQSEGWWSLPGRLENEAWPSVMVKVLKLAVPELGSVIRPRKSAGSLRP
jgi:A/G-specific adenine glycosylase